MPVGNPGPELGLPQKADSLLTQEPCCQRAVRKKGICVTACEPTRPIPTKDLGFCDQTVTERRLIPLRKR